MRRLIRNGLFASLLVLAACNTTAPPSNNFSTLSTHTISRAAFLPPVGSEVDTSAFFAGADVWIQVLSSTQPTAELETIDGSSIRVEDGYYLGLWNVRNTARNASLVTVLVWRDDVREGQECIIDHGYPESACLIGSFDAQIRKDKRIKAGPDVLDLTNVQTLPIKVYLEGTTPDSLSDLQPLADGSTFTDSQANCTINEFNMPGQGVKALGAGVKALGAGVKALGAEGGLFLLGPDDTLDSEAPVIRLFEAGEAGLLAAEEAGILGYDLASTDPLSQDAAILVVDDYGADTSGQPIYKLENGLTDPDSNLSVEDLGNLVDGDGFSHGALVLHQVVAMVEAAGFSRLTPEDWEDFILFSRPGDIDPIQYLVVAAVDTEGLDTDHIDGRIQNALNGLRYYSELSDTDGFDVRDVAINMSFAIVPCSILNDFDASGYDTFEEYVLALGNDNEVAAAFYDDLVELLVTPLGGDNEPLLQQIEQCEDTDIVIGGISTQSMFVYDPELGSDPEWPGGISWTALVHYPEEYYYEEFPAWDCTLTDSSIVYVASSGNFSLPYAMYPAAWPLVVSTSSQDATEPSGFALNKSSFSNSGEVMAPGALYKLGASADSGSSRIIAYAGTSFSAPVLSLFTALDLMYAAPECGLSNTSRLTSAPDEANAPLGEAVAAYCP